MIATTDFDGRADVGRGQFLDQRCSCYLLTICVYVRVCDIFGDLNVVYKLNVDDVMLCIT